MLLSRLIRTLNTWYVYIGKDPADLPGHSIIIFPVQKDVLCCGLAGILVLKRSSGSVQGDVFSRLSGFFARIRPNALDSVLEGATSPEEYLCPHALDSFDRELYLLKQDPLAQQQMIYETPIDQIEELARQMGAFIDEEEDILEKHAARFSTKEMETMSQALIYFKDILWGLGEDLLGNQWKILELSGRETILSPQAFEKYQRINFTLNALDRLEVRGRDSCGMQVALAFNETTVFKEVLDRIKKDGLYEEFMERCSPGDLWNRAVHLSPNSITFTYKTALVTGDLGDNTKKLRRFIVADSILHLVLDYANDSQMYLAHTRWASVGAINEANCHPVNNFSVDSSSEQQRGLAPANKLYPYYGKGPGTINVVLNGDIDNHASLKENLEPGKWQVDSRITTDTKVIPLQIERYLYEGHDLKEAFRKA